jgi:glycolate oxidase FAD binding subunit
VDLTGFADEVGSDGPVTVAGAASRGGPVGGVRVVTAPSGIDWFRPDEMTVGCGASTRVDELLAELAVAGQTVAMPPGGTVGGALAVGRSGVRRLGDGPIRDTLLQARYVGADGQIVKAGGPTVKNVSGFDLCRLLVGSRGTIGFIGDVILRTRPIASHEQWFVSGSDPAELLRRLYRPTSVLWDGRSCHVLLSGHPTDVAEQAAGAGLELTGGPPQLPTGGRWSMAPSRLADVVGSGRFVAEVGVGIVHHEHPAPAVVVEPAVRELHRRIKDRFDPTGRLNPGLDVLEP